MSRSNPDETRTTLGSNLLDTGSEETGRGAFDPNRDSFQIDGRAHGMTATMLVPRNNDPRRTMRPSANANPRGNAGNTGRSNIVVPQPDENTTQWGLHHPIPEYPGLGAVPLADAWGNFKGWSKPGYKNDGGSLMDLTPGPRRVVFGTIKRWKRTVHEELLNIVPFVGWVYGPGSAVGHVHGTRDQWGMSMFASMDHWQSKEAFEDAVMEFMARCDRRRNEQETDEDMEIRKLLFKTARLVRKETYMHVVHQKSYPSHGPCRETLRHVWQYLRRQQVERSAAEREMDDWQLDDFKMELRDWRKGKEEFEKMHGVVALFAPGKPD